MSKKTIMKNAAAIATAAALAASLSQVANAADESMEKCYGVVKAGKNDCGNARHACSGQSKAGSNSEEWVYLPKGTCERLAAGSLTPVVSMPENKVESTPGNHMESAPENKQESVPEKVMNDMQELKHDVQDVIER